MIRLVTMAVLALPILEIIGFVVIGGRIGLSLTLLWMLVAAMAGLALIRHGGLNALTRLQATLNQQREPGHSLIDGAVMVVAGLLLIVPGFVSDLLALILILPVTRNFLLRRAAAHFETRIYRPATAGAQSTGASRSSTVIEGEFEIVEAADAPTPPKPARRPPTTTSTIEQLDDPS
jgi:UPF0716 protein FxsA